MLRLIEDDAPSPTTLFTIRIPVRWADVDSDGHVNNTIVLRYVEEARMQWAHHLGLSACAPELMPIVASIACKYLAPVGYPTKLDVNIGCSQLGNSSLHLTFDVRDSERGTLYAQATAVWVWVNAVSKRPSPMPDVLRQACLAPS